MFHLGGILNYGKFAMYDKYIATNGTGYLWGGNDSVSRTDSDGMVTLESDEVKNPSSGATFTFKVTDVVLPSWTYAGGDDTGSVLVQ